MPHDRVFTFGLTPHHRGEFASVLVHAAVMCVLCKCANLTPENDLTVMTKSEVSRILDAMSSTYVLLAKLMYGCGLRIQGKVVGVIRHFG